MINIPKKKLIEYFEKRVRFYFFEIFKLYDFELTIGSQSKRSARTSAYWHDLDEGSGMIAIFYSENWIKEKPSREEIDKCAFHEVCESLLSELQELISERYINKKDLPNAVHRVIRRLENSIFDVYKDKKNYKNLIGDRKKYEDKPK